jgi:hypothetical protein
MNCDYCNKKVKFAVRMAEQASGIWNMKFVEDTWMCKNCFKKWLNKRSETNAGISNNKKSTRNS